MAAGYVCRHVGDRFKAQLPRLVESLLRQRRGLDYCVACCFRGVFKSLSPSVVSYIPASVDFARRTILRGKQASSVASIKLLKALMRYEQVPVESVLYGIHLILQDDQIPFIKNEVSLLIARIAFSKLSATAADATADGEWRVTHGDDRSHVFEAAVKVLSLFPGVYSMSVPYFFNLMTPAMFAQGHAVLLRFLTSSCQTAINQFVPMLRADVRFTYFDELAAAQPSASQLRLVEAFCPDNESIVRVCQITSLCTDKNASLDFFANLARSQPGIALDCLNRALGAFSPNDAAVGYSILCNLPRLEEVNREPVDHLIETIFRTPNLSSQMFSDLFRIPPCCRNLPVRLFSSQFRPRRNSWRRRG
jgi:hypothetical protein